MKLSRTAIHIYRRGAAFVLPADAKSAVSLHSHSFRSRASLDFVPGLARRIPVVDGLFIRSTQEYEQRNGEPIDFASWYWRPPLSPARVVQSERDQIARRFDCKALVSLTDHDTIEGPRLLRAAGASDVPLSFEWTVPYEGTVLHLGVHNIGPARVDETERALAAYTAGTALALRDLLEMLSECPETFVVLNHPYWDLMGIGGMRHDSILLSFLRAHRDWIHALELNGYRTWNENRRVLPLSEGFGLPVVAGGDRHATTANTIVNLSAAGCLSEFAYELRAKRSTYCVILPEYLEPHAARIFQTEADALRSFPG